MSRNGWTLFGALGAIWGVPYLLIKVATGGVTPAVLVCGRTSLGALILLPVALAHRELAPVLARWKPLLAYTVVELLVPWYLLASAEQRLPSSLSALVVAAVPILGAVLARTTGARERLGPARLAGLATGAGGVAVLVGLDVHSTDLGAVAELLAVVVGYSLGPWIFHRHLADLPSVGVVVASLLGCALFYAPFAALELPSRVPSADVLLSIAGLGVLCTATAFLVFFALIAEVGPARATVVTYVNPAVAVLAGVTVLHEPFAWSTALGFVLVLGGSLLATRPYSPCQPVWARRSARRAA